MKDHLIFATLLMLGVASIIDGFSLLNFARRIDALEAGQSTDP